MWFSMYCTLAMCDCGAFLSLTSVFSIQLYTQNKRAQLWQGQKINVIVTYSKKIKFS